MREIKFRAWDKSRQKFHNSGNLHIEVSPQGTLCWAFGMSMCEPLFGDERDNWVLMQYTSLKDKNGGEIFEGDILQFGDGTCREVSYDHEHTGFKLQDEDPVNPLWQMYKSMEVVGNIYENPELLDRSA